MARMDVAFAVVPFADIPRPAIGVSLLKAGLVNRGFSSRISYFNLNFAELIGEEIFSYISDHSPADSMTGEWFFADLAFPGQLPPAYEFVRNVLGKFAPPAMVDRILEARTHRAAFVEHSAQTLKAAGAPIVGFTTVFHQTCAALAIARRLKEMPDPPVICFGGANCEGEMGLQMLRSFPWIDYVCTREGDAVFPEFVERFLKHGEKGELPGLLHRGESTQLTYPPVVEDMDNLPIPNYDDFVESLKASELGGRIKPEIQIETSRGCWWGAKHHCTFCGLNGDTMRYRSKSPGRVYQELKLLYQRYGIKRIDSVDNILDHRYISSVFPRLAEEGIELEMFYEVKANLKRTQLLALRRGGIKFIQPGIESFSSEVLRLMDKGVTGIQNLQLLKWTEEVGIRPGWNLLAGFPGEPASAYEQMASLIPLLTHLEPPTTFSPIRLDRFSPLFSSAEACGLRRVRPTYAYYYVYPLGKRELARLAYFFDFDYEDQRRPESYIQALQAEVTEWRAARFRTNASCRPRLDLTVLDHGEILVIDTRDCAVAREQLLSKLDAQLLLACDAGQTQSFLKQEVAVGEDDQAITDALNRLAEAKLIVHIDNKFLGLPVWRNRPPAEMETEIDVRQSMPTTANPESLLRIL
jgi:ribosomal peptide maturation radical SAM protein 1